MLNVSIPKPCYEDWDAMSPNEQGRHCNSCAKTVVDFTVMTDEEIQHFFLKRKNEDTCGRFRGEQLGRITITLQHDLFETGIACWKKFLAACLLAFSTMLFSCNTQMGVPVEKQVIDKAETNLKAKDSLPQCSGYVGMAFTWDSTRLQTIQQGMTAVDVTIPNDTIPGKESDSNTVKDSIPTLLNDTTLVQTPDSTIKIDTTVQEKILTNDSSCNDAGVIYL